MEVVVRSMSASRSTPSTPCASHHALLVPWGFRNMAVIRPIATIPVAQMIKWRSVIRFGVRSFDHVGYSQPIALHLPTACTRIGQVIDAEFIFAIDAPQQTPGSTMLARVVL